MSEERKVTCPRHDWERVQVSDHYGVRLERFRCRHCAEEFTRSSQSPTLGDRHRRMD